MNYINRKPEREDIRHRYGAALSSGSPFRLVVSGVSGIGKRTLIARMRRELARDYTGGTLHINAYGDHPQVVADANDLASQIMIGAKAVQTDFPVQEKFQVAAMQAVVGDKRWLIIVEGVTTPEQLRPLFVGGLNNVDMIAMSDNPIPELEDLGFSRPVLTLDGFGDEDGLELIASVAGNAVGSVEPEKLKTLSRAYMGVPGFLTVIARELRHGNSTVDDFILAAHSGTALRDVRAEGHAVIGPALDRICLGLATEIRRAYRLWSLKSGVHCRLQSAAAMLDIPVGHADRSRRVLLERKLIEDLGHDRFRMPELVRMHGVGLAREVDTDDDRHAAELRGLAEDARYALGLAKSISERSIASGFIADAYRDVAPIHEGTSAVADGFADFNIEYPNLIVGAVRALELNAELTSVLIATALQPFAYQTARVDRLRDIYRNFLDIIDSPQTPSGLFKDPRVQWQILRDLAGLYERQGCLAEAEALLLRAAEIDYPAGRASVLEWLGILYGQQAGRTDEALATFDAAWKAVGRIPDPDQQARSYGLLRMHIGRTLAECGRRDEAIKYLTAAVEFFLTVSHDSYNAARCLVHLGDIAVEHERLTEAISPFSAGAEQYDQIGMYLEAAKVYDKLGTVADMLNCHAEATGYRAKAAASRATA